MHVIHTRYTNETAIEGEWCISSGCLGRENGGEDCETEEEVEECALSVIGAARRCIVPAVGMKTREFSQLLVCTQHEDVRASLSLTVLATLADRNYRLSCRKSIFLPAFFSPVPLPACMTKNM